MVTLRLPSLFLSGEKEHHLPTTTFDPRGKFPRFFGGFNGDCHWLKAKWIKDNLDGNIPQGLSEPVIVKYADTLGAPVWGDIQEGFLCGHDDVLCLKRTFSYFFVFFHRLQG